MAQIKQHKPPPNPAKITDSRAAAYIEKFGNKSWEVDALPPRVLTQLIENEIKKHVDIEAMQQIIEQEKRDKESLRKAVEGIR